MQKFTGLQYLKIDIASTYGHDKLPWADRISWFDKTIQAPYQAGEDINPVLDQLLDEAKEPALFYAGLKAWEKTLRGEPTGYAISLDATASGLQILSCLARCESSARLCNVIDTGTREDAYQTIYRLMRAEVEARIAAAEDLEDPEIQDAQERFTRLTKDEVKQACLTSLYGSIQEPEKAFGTGLVLDAFWATMAKALPGAWALKSFLEELWIPYATSYSWTLPDLFEVTTPVTSSIWRTVMVEGVPTTLRLKAPVGSKTGKALAPNIVHSIDGFIVREIVRRCSFDRDRIIAVMELLSSGEVSRIPEKASENDIMVAKLWQAYLCTGYLSVRILDHLQPTNLCEVDLDVIRDLVLSLPETSFPVMTIHDAFRVRPNHGNDIREQYANCLSDLTASNLLSHIVFQISGEVRRLETVPHFGSLVRESNYALS